MPQFRVYYHGNKIGALGLKEHLATVFVSSAKDTQEALDKSREEILPLYNTHEHIHAYRVEELGQ